MHILRQVFRSEAYVIGTYVQAQSGRKQEIRMQGVQQSIPFQLQTERSF